RDLEEVEDVAVDMKDNNSETQQVEDAEEDIKTLRNQPIEDKKSNEFLRNISDLESEEEEEVLDEESLMSSEKATETVATKPVYKEPGINNTGPSVKDKLAQIMGTSEAVAEEQKEEIEEEASAYKTRRMPRLDETTNTAMNNLAASNQQFGFNVYEQLAETQKGNIVFSPFALSTSMAMTYGGARNTTESQMLKVLQFQQTSKNLHRNYENILDELTGGENALFVENTGTELMLGNSIWIDEKFEVSDPYSDVVKKRYHGILQNVSFKDKAAMSEKLTEWAKVKTAYNILDGDLAMDFKINEADIVLANSLHLMTKWNLPFDKSFTQATNFKLREDSSLQVNMMHTQGDFGYFENSMVKVVSMPCNDDYTMLLLMPKAYFQLKAVQKTLMRGGYTHWLNAMEDKKVQLSVPRFSVNTQVDMTAPLEKIGMTEAFDKRAADFSGMFNKRSAPVSNVLHPVHIHINESGISTDEGGFAVGSSSENEVENDEDASVFEANRPFLFIVMDNHRKHLLLMGRVNQPELAE
ncbi:MAG: serpin family protein, partial [Chitinophagales bacterium]